MNELVFTRWGLDDPRLAAHATDQAPVWLWSADGARILWANPSAWVAFGATTMAALTGREFWSADPVRLQVAWLAATLPPAGTARIERLHGFAPYGPHPFRRPLSCDCSLIPAAAGGSGTAVLIKAVDFPGISLSLQERVHRLLSGSDAAVVAIAPNGAILDATPQARHRLTDATHTDDIGASPLCAAAMVDGAVAGETAIGPVSLRRIGNGTSTLVLACFTQGAVTESEKGRNSDAGRIPVPAVATMSPLGFAAEPVQRIIHADLPAATGAAETTADIGPGAANVVFFPALPTEERPNFPPDATLRPIEKAFDELRRELLPRLHPSLGETLGYPAPRGSLPSGAEPKRDIGDGESRRSTADQQRAAPPVAPAAEMLAQPAGPRIAIECKLLDRMPLAIIVHRRGELLFANREAFAVTGYPDLAAIIAVGGLDGLFPSLGVANLASDAAVPARVLATCGGAQVPIRARAFALDWDGTPASALLLETDEAKERFNSEEAELQRVTAEASALRAVLEAAALRQGAASVALRSKPKTAASIAYPERRAAAPGDAVAVLDANASAPPGATNLNEIVRSCIAQLQPPATAAHVLLRLSLSRTLPALHADARSVRRSVENVLAHALRTSRPGGQVIISTAVSATSEVVLRVRNESSGVGASFPAACQPRRAIDRADMVCGQ